MSDPGFDRPPQHYSGAEEAIDVIRRELGDEKFIGFCLGNAMKYRLRSGRKPGADTDLEKASWYEQMARHVEDPRHPDPRRYRA